MTMKSSDAARGVGRASSVALLLAGGAVSVAATDSSKMVGGVQTNHSQRKFSCKAVGNALRLRILRYTAKVICIFAITPPPPQSARQRPSTSFVL